MAFCCVGLILFVKFKVAGVFTLLVSIVVFVGRVAGLPNYLSENTNQLLPTSCLIGE